MRIFSIVVGVAAVMAGLVYWAAPRDSHANPYVPSHVVVREADPGEDEAAEHEAEAEEPEPLTDEELGLFDELLEGQEMPPDSLVRAYAAYAEAARAGNLDRLWTMCLPQSVTISREPRPEGEEGHGEGINLPFARKHFHEKVLTTRKENACCRLLRTGSTAIWFVQTSECGWRVYRVLDKPIM